MIRRGVSLGIVDPRVCSNDNDDRCVEQRKQLEQIENHCNGENIRFGVSTNTQIGEKQFNIYGSLPKLCFFRDGFPVLYSGSYIHLKEEYFHNPLCFRLIIECG